MPSGQKPKVYDARTVQAVAQFYASGKTQAEVGAALGLSQKVIWNLMRRHSLPRRTAAKRNQTGENNSYWKGNKAGKQAFHKRLYARFGKPTRCTRCGTTSAKHYDYANLTGHYEDMADYAAMCRSCHWKYDGKISNITKGGKKYA